MAKCGKGCMPECQYFTTGGCISPFNCPYKIETGYINSATSVIGSYTQGKDDLNEPKIKKWFRSLVEEGKIQQESMNYDAATLQIYIDHLEKENAALRERLGKAVELPFKNLDKVFILAGEDTEDTMEKQFIPVRIVEGTIVGFGYDVYEWANGNYKFNYYVLVGENNYIFALEQFNKTLFKTREAAEKRLAELNGGKQ